MPEVAANGQFSSPIDILVPFTSLSMLMPLPELAVALVVG
jgi:hypothetical protein